jgi:HEAT repeat protein
MLRFGLRDVLMLMLVVGLGLGWWVDRREMESRVALGELRIKKLQDRRTRFQMLTQEATKRAERSAKASAKRPPPFWSAQDVTDFIQSDPSTDDIALAELRDALVRTRGMSFTPEVTRELLGLLSDRSAEVRARAVCAMGALLSPTPSDIRAIVPLVRDSSPDVRRQAEEALANYKGYAHTAIPALRADMLDDNSETAAHAALCLIQIDSRQQIGPRLMELVKSRHADNRQRAVAHLQYYFPPDEVEDALTRAFADEPDERVRDAIATALNRLP